VGVVASTCSVTDAEVFQKVSHLSGGKRAWDVRPISGQGRGSGAEICIGGSQISYMDKRNETAHLEQVVSPPVVCW